MIKLISQVIADFADGEISQAASLFDTGITLQKYLDKSFYKTASLMAAACRSAAVFSECSVEGAPPPPLRCAGLPQSPLRCAAPCATPRLLRTPAPAFILAS